MRYNQILLAILVQRSTPCKRGNSFNPGQELMWFRYTWNDVETFRGRAQQLRRRVHKCFHNIAGLVIVVPSTKLFTSPVAT
ncbi:hypothetical protein J6590_033310 [Homalodisca vitripennis]|nr:hypothetical protein J6590_033310 [Homalodisca vitripennis]